MSSSGLGRGNAVRARSYCAPAAPAPVRLEGWPPQPCVVVLLVSCNSTPLPSTQPSTPPSTSSPSPIASPVAPTSLDECDPAGYVPCDQQAAVLSIPIVDTNLALTYSSQWAAGRLERPTWNADGLGLGGWSVNVLEGYDTANGVLLGADGSWRFATGVALAAGGQAVPSFDGSLAYVFDAAGSPHPDGRWTPRDHASDPVLRRGWAPQRGRRLDRRAGSPPDRPALRPRAANGHRRDRRSVDGAPPERGRPARWRAQPERGRDIRSPGPPEAWSRPRPIHWAASRSSPTTRTGT